jgi:23S rRNA pseudouridine1911/1915/1917 synthase
MRRTTYSEALPLAVSARKPISRGLDLEAVEAFERLLLLEEAQQKRQQQRRVGDKISFQDYESDDDEEEEFETDDDTGSEGDDSFITLEVPPELHNKRIDAALAALMPPDLELSRSLCGSLLEERRVVLVVSEKGDGGSRMKLEPIRRKSHKIHSGQVLRIALDPSRGSDTTPDYIVPQNLPLDVVYEDSYMIVLNKSPGMVVHPGAGNRDGTLVNALAYYLARNTTMGSGDYVVAGDASAKQPSTSLLQSSVSTSSNRPGIVHRLDKGTSGVLVVAKTVASHAKLSEAFAQRKVRKTYLAVCAGTPLGSSSDAPLIIDEPIGRHPVHRQRMRVVPEVHRDSMVDDESLSRHRRRLGARGRRAVSIVTTVATHGGKLSLVKVRILTGRTHQIRVHLQHRGAPVGGDDLYGLPDWNRRLAKSHGISRPLLHAYQLELEHPATGQLMTFTAPMPLDMSRIASMIYPQGAHEHPELFREER